MRDLDQHIGTVAVKLEDPICDEWGNDFVDGAPIATGSGPATIADVTEHPDFPGGEVVVFWLSWNGKGGQ